MTVYCMVETVQMVSQAQATPIPVYTETAYLMLTLQMSRIETILVSMEVAGVVGA